MNKIALLALLAFVAVCTAFATVDQKMEFDQWAKHHGKHYPTLEEKAKRMSIYFENKERIAFHNAHSKSSRHGVNQFTDMTQEEFKNYPCGGNLMGRTPNNVVAEGAERPEVIPVPDALPTSWDWTQHGAVTPIKNQGQCGSCWAFSTVGMLEGAWFNAGNNLTSLSEMEFVDCSTTSYGCDGGWPYWALGDIVTGPEGGKVDTEASYPYQPVQGSCTWQAAKRVVGATYANYTSYCKEGGTPCTETEMMTLLYTKGPLSACLNATPMQSYTGGIDDPADCDPQSIDHCITIVGYGVSPKGEEFWKIKNSWGTSWGEQGYYQLKKGTAAKYGICGINSVITLAEITL